MIILDDLQRQLDELSIKFEWQENNKNLTTDERIENLKNLIDILDDDEAYPYVKLYESYERFKRFGIDIK